MKFKSSLLIALIALPCLCASFFAQALVLKPGETQTVNFDQLRSLEKGPVPQALPKVAARATITLQADGQTLVVKLQHLSVARGSTAALYAFDLGLTNKQAVEMRATATYSEFPAQAMWIGPTDAAELTAGKGSFTFAARDAIVREIDDYLRSAIPLPPSFLQAGQQGCITIKLTSQNADQDVGKNKPLRLSPMAYFVIPEPTAPTARRLRMVARMSNGNGQ